LVERVVPAAELDGAVEAWVGSIVESGPHAIRLQKELIQYWETVGVSDGVQEGIRNFTRAWHGDEPGRMIKAFLDRRRKK
jgi:1,4-dihydroxy-2-naphthoyl-CoA synthase